MLRRVQEESTNVRPPLPAIPPADTDPTPHARSEKARQKVREDKWQRLRTAAIRNKSDASPLPATLVPGSSIMPEGTYNPVREASLDAMESKFGDDMDEEHHVEDPVSPPTPSLAQLEPQPQHQMMDSDDAPVVDGPTDLVRPRFHPPSRCVGR